jgi:hypothetical protein
MSARLLDSAAAGKEATGVGSDAATDWRLAVRKRLQALVLDDAELVASLAEAWDPEDFTARLAAVAARHGGGVGAGEIRQLLAFGAGPPPLATAAPPGWLPAHIAGEGEAALVEWVFFGERRLLEPFYEASLRAVSLSPFNRLLGFRTRLAELPATDSPAPAGLIFHMSRCGSTLVAQMLAASARNVVVSEASPIDAVVRLGAVGLEPGQHARLLRAMVGTAGRASAGETRLFVKLDSWHARALPLFRRAFPSTPWVFLIREPAEVLASHGRLPGLQATGLLTADDVGVAWRYEASHAENTAAALAAICEAAEAACSAGGGLVVNYDELPTAAWTRVLPHFGVHPLAAEVAAMVAVAGRDAKQPGSPFTPDTDAKRAAATKPVRAAVAGRLADAYARLEGLRRAQSPAPGA